MSVTIVILANWLLLEYPGVFPAVPPQRVPCAQALVVSCGIGLVLTCQLGAAMSRVTYKDGCDTGDMLLVLISILFGLLVVATPVMATVQLCDTQLDLSATVIMIP